MKFLTAEEARGLTKPKDDPIAQAIEAINRRVTERGGMGHLDALIGYAGGTECFASLASTDRQAIRDALHMAGFVVQDGPAPKTIRVAWGEMQDE